MSLLHGLVLICIQNLSFQYLSEDVRSVQMHGKRFLYYFYAHYYL